MTELMSLAVLGSSPLRNPITDHGVLGAHGVLDAHR
jgi:hypothetical protein